MRAFCVVLSLLLVAPGAARAEGWLDRLNRAVAAANSAMGEGVDALAAAVPGGNPIPVSWREAGSNFIVNTVNEPLSALSHAIAGNLGDAGTALRRFGINIRDGYGGLRDAATAQGVTVPPADIGLALCARGVPEGPFVVLPIAGPRTVRDGAADIVVTSGIIYGALLPLIGPFAGAGTMLVVFVVDEALTLLLARQIDQEAITVTAVAEPLGFEAQREAYLAERRLRCQAMASR
jgi:phospholipid-binding lipoprotein MlaA